MTTVYDDGRADAFLSFLDQVGKGQCDPNDWDRFAVAHYTDEWLEEARRELVRVAIQVRIECWGDPIPEAVKSTASELLNRLSHKG